MKAKILLLTFSVAAALSLSPKAVQAGIDIAPSNLGGFEPNNAVVNPQNPSQVAVMQGCTVRISNDFGQNYPVTWVTNASSCRGDPSLAFDSAGRLFVTHLSNDPGEQSVLAGQITDLTTSGTFTTTVVSSVNGTNDDKQWLVADANPVSPFRDNLYMVWIELGAPWQIMFSRSTDQGANWSPPQALSPVDNDNDGLVDEDAINGVDDDGDSLVDEDPPEGDTWPAHIAVAANGDVYIAYHANSCRNVATPATEGTVPIIRDGTGGAAFAAGIVPQAGTAFGPGEATITCNRQDDAGDPDTGDNIPGLDVWLQGQQPFVLPDPWFSNQVYVVANDDPNDAYNNGDDADVVIARSDDFGQSFTHGRVDHDPGQSFAIMPAAHIDQDGKIAVTWYTNRRLLMNNGTTANFGTPNFLLDLYGTTSEDGGETFTEDFRINDQPFDPDVNNNLAMNNGCRFGSLASNDCTGRIGEYNGIWTVDAIAYASWTGNGTPPGPPFPADGSGGMRTYFDIFSMDGAHPDRLEPNESRDFAVVADLGADDIYNQANLGIHSATDVDFFRVEALHSGLLAISIRFNEILAALDFDIQDSTGAVIESGDFSTLQTGSSEVSEVIPVVKGETYFVRVFDPNAPNNFAPQATYDLTIVNRPAPVPFGLDLLLASDSGSDNADDITNDVTPTLRLRVDVVDAAQSGIDILSPAEVASGDAGYAIAVFLDGLFVDYADPVGGTDQTVWEFTHPGLSDGERFFTAEVRVFDLAQSQANGFGGESGSLLVTVDTVAPAEPGTPDLLASSDSAGISIDNITTIMSPAFRGTVEANTQVRIYADGDEVGLRSAGSSGDYEITVEPLADGVYDVTATAEDLAGNISNVSDALSVTIANQSLSLAGAGAGGVAVDLGDSTLTGYPGIPGGVIGILGIPVVNLNVNGQSLEVLGTPGSDAFLYSPDAPDGGSLVLVGRSQVLNFSNVGGGPAVMLDPLSGNDRVVVNGTVANDSIVGTVDTIVTIQVNNLLPVALPSANIEHVVPMSAEGVDTIDVTIFDSVNGNLTVDASVPSTNPNRGDELIVRAGSNKAKILTQPSSVKGSGSVLLSYDMTTGAESRVDYVNVEKVSKVK